MNPHVSPLPTAPLSLFSLFLVELLKLTCGHCQQLRTSHTISIHNTIRVDQCTHWIMQLFHLTVKIWSQFFEMKNVTCNISISIDCGWIVWSIYCYKFSIWMSLILKAPPCHPANSTPPPEDNKWLRSKRRIKRLRMWPSLTAQCRNVGSRKCFLPPLTSVTQMTIYKTMVEVGTSVRAEAFIPSECESPVVHLETSVSTVHSQSSLKRLTVFNSSNSIRSNKLENPEIHSKTLQILQKTRTFQLTKYI